jgi:hypothetical protein
MNTDALTLEKKSCAVTLSDMELFLFPDLMYALVLANILSPRIWKWREDAWFSRREKKPYRRIARVKQYIMDHYAFNLDLDTWGLTTKERELARFRGTLDEDALRQSNALFGYEGDKYYFDIDIRTHFGLDKYEGHVIPYWKTETVEAMDAFCHKPGYSTGAGECVSLAALYASSLFLVADIPLGDIYMMATPLHSQNFIDVDDGVLTNNRRLVTKTMWFNGTALSAQARRAMENERVTIVCHRSGYIHTLFKDATIDPEAYRHFRDKLSDFLHAGFGVELLGNFLRDAREFQKCFQFRWPIRGTDHYVAVEKVFPYEQDSSFLFTDQTRDKLMADVDSELFHPSPIPERIILNDLEAFARSREIHLSDPRDVEELRGQFSCGCLNAQAAIEALIRFCRVSPRIPVAEEKTFHSYEAPLDLTGAMRREEMLERLESLRGRNALADMAFYAYRDLNRTDAEPFVKAAMERSPVSIEMARDLCDGGLIQTVQGLAEESIYDGTGRLAQPDEVWNYRRGDGVEKALLLANLWAARKPDDAITLIVEPDRAVLKAGHQEWIFASAKAVRAQEWKIR